jgi:hypothetical protein
MIEWKGVDARSWLGDGSGCAADGDDVPIVEDLGTVVSADNAGDAEFAGDEGADDGH